MAPPGAGATPKGALDPKSPHREASCPPRRTQIKMIITFAVRSVEGSPRSPPGGPGAPGPAHRRGRPAGCGRFTAPAGALPGATAPKPARPGPLARASTAGTASAMVLAGAAGVVAAANAVMTVTGRSVHRAAGRGPAPGPRREPRDGRHAVRARAGVRTVAAARSPYVAIRSTPALREAPGSTGKHRRRLLEGNAAAFVTAWHSGLRGRMARRGPAAGAGRREARTRPALTPARRPPV